MEIEGEAGPSGSGQQPGTPAIADQHATTSVGGSSSLGLAGAGASSSSAAAQPEGSSSGRVISMAERVQLEQEYKTEMKERFLRGHDADYVDYGAIDGDQELDDHWLEQRGRDEEERYFDE